MGRKLQYIGLSDGTTVEAEIVSESDAVAHAVHRELQVSDVRIDPGELTMIATDEQSGYDLIDNEILAGLQLHRLAGIDRYPAEVSRLVGYNAAVTEPFVLLEPYRGVPVSEVAGKLLTADRRRFQISLLTGLRWLTVAGIAHRNINPHTVRWDEDSRTVQITGFLNATVFGAPRQIVGTLPWAAPEQRPDRITGDVGERDDIWAMGRLIFYVLTGEEPADRNSIRAEPELGQLLEGVFQAPADRPTCRELLVNRLGIKDPLPGPRQDNPALAKGREDFWVYYHGKKRQHSDSGNSGHAGESGQPAAGTRASRPWWRIITFSAVGVVGVLFAIVIILNVR